jgi:hypothetical protein
MKLRHLLAACAIACVAALCAFPVLAEAPPLATDSTIAVGAFVSTFVVPFLGSLLLAVGTWALAYVGQHYKVAASTGLIDIANSAMQNGIAFGLSKLDAAAKSGALDMNTKNAVLADAGNYALTHAPAAMKSIGITDPSAEGTILGEKLAARLETAMPAVIAAAPPAA